MAGQKSGRRVEAARGSKAKKIGETRAARGDENSIRDALATELFGVCVGVLKQYGMDAARLFPLMARAVEGNHTQIPVTKRVLSDMRCLAELGNKWAQDYNYLEVDGRPKILNIRGRGMSLQRLSKEFFGKRPVDEIVDLGCRTRLMERLDDDHVRHFGGCVMFTGIPTLMLAYSVRSVLWSMHTSVLNSRRKGGVNALPDRTAFAVLPEDELSEFVRVMRSQISALIEMSDRWLTSRAHRAVKKSSKKATIGIQAYIFKHKTIS